MNSNNSNDNSIDHDNASCKKVVVRRPSLAGTSATGRFTAGGDQSWKGSGLEISKEGSSTTSFLWPHV